MGVGRMTRDLSVLIPARNEEWLGHTVRDVLANLRADTEIIVVLDGAWPTEPLPQHDRLKVVYLGQSIGQRAATNLAARLSTARFVMKLDAHCAVAEGFDRVLIDSAAELGPDVTQIPAQYNLHVYTWSCRACRSDFYQGPTLTVCPTCQTDGQMERVIVWKRRESRRTTAWRFDSDLHFQYWRESEKRQQGDICDVMTSLGACFFMSRERFWELGGLDDTHGSWGQFGVEIACKSWLSGGRHVANKRTWFAHFFRVGGIGFPYPISGGDQERARKYSRDLWMGNRWPGQVRPLRWLLDKFAPVPGWAAEQIAALPDLKREPSKGILYYTDNRCPEPIASAVRQKLAETGLPIVSVSLAPLDFGQNIVLPLERGYLTMFRQILAGLEAMDTDVVFFCEHDVLYDASHFACTPPRRDCYYYNVNVWKVDAQTGRAVTYLTKQTSGLCADRKLLIEHYRKRVAMVERDGFSRRMGFEPGSHGRKERVDDIPSDVWRSPVPIVDIRHTANLTESRWSPEQFRDQRNCQGWTEADEIPGLGRTRGRFAEWLADAVGVAV